MKIPFIHRGLFIESLRRLRLAGMLMTVIPLMLTVPQLMVTWFTARDFYYPDFYELYVLLYALPFIAPTVLTAILFSAQTHRCDSDFYHSLPLTKRSLNVSWLAAVMCWLTIIIVGSSAIVWMISLVNQSTEPLNVLLTVGGALLASFMVTAVLFLAYSLSGNTVSTMFFAAIILFAPLAIAYLLSLPLADYHPILSGETVNLAHYQLLYGNEDKPLAWTFTAIATAVCLLLGYVAAGKRRSELAGHASTSRALQTTLRLTVAYVFCLPAIYAFLFDSDALSSIVYYVIALVVYFLFELFTTKKAKNMLKAIPWLGVLVVLNAVTVLMLLLASHMIYKYSPTPDEIDSISVTKLHQYHSDQDKYYNGEAWGLSDADVDDDSPDTYYSPEDFWYFESVYEEYHAAEIKVSDKELIAIACHALERNIQYSQSDDYSMLAWLQQETDAEVFYRVTIAFHDNLHTRYRTVWLSSGEFVALFDPIYSGAHLPSNHVWDIDMLDTYS